ncbi:hypothetical protein KXV74_001738 [Aspergillus fumigatus]|nr:hypothetical protein KXX47_007467 [Aspergillus fumigatus]KAH1451560.1 hypothetical protein KXX58_003993 [Aspergillus fumigatus]KAH1660422.1 hypothetical protein KXX65_004068 [Aspergillus fumigatus]KAH1808417.1 hypothetical protein KXX19_009637 [Aspergillus fumigatus]KAH1843929.1 hypothetical protein KXX54_000657 [Aspergillus fumigatus]
MDRSGQQPRSAVGGIRPKASPLSRPPTPARVRQIQQLHKPAASRSVWRTSIQRSDREARERKARQAEEVRESWLGRLRKNFYLLILRAPKGTVILIRLTRQSTFLMIDLAISVLQQETDGFANSASDIA